MTKILVHIPFYRYYKKAIDSWRNLRCDNLIVKSFVNTDDRYPKEEIFKNIAHKMNQARDIVLKQNYDYLFNIEDDIIVPADAIQKLLSVKKQVVSGLYRLRPSSIPYMPFCARIPDSKVIYTRKERYIEAPKDFRYGKVIHSVFSCFGCIIISRSVLEKIKFRSKGDNDFSLDCRCAYIQMYCHTGVRCGHIDRNNQIVYA